MAHTLDSVHNSEATSSREDQEFQTYLHNLKALCTQRASGLTFTILLTRNYTKGDSMIPLRLQTRKSSSESRSPAW